MTAELRRTTRERTSADLYEVTGIERVTRELCEDIRPVTVNVDLNFDEERQDWVLRWLTIKGPMYKVNGKLGTRWVDHLYSERSQTLAPDWAQDLVRQSLAEVSRPAPTESAALIRLPADVGPNVQVVTFHQSHCRSCGEASPVIRDENSTLYEWNNAHRLAVGHSSFFTYEVSRSTAKIVVL